MIAASLAVLFITSLNALAVLASSDSAPTPRVAVLISGGDFGALEKSFQALERKAKETYEKHGFKVIIIGGANPASLPFTGHALQQALTSVRGVQDLRLDFIGHGGMFPASGSNVDAIAISKTRRSNAYGVVQSMGNRPLMWVAGDSHQAGGKYEARAGVLGFSPRGRNDITHTDIAKALQAFQQKNPDGIAILNLVNCFSGAVAQKLRKDPKAIVYANSPHNNVGLLAEDVTGYKSSMDHYFSNLNRPDTSTTLDQARLTANTTMGQTFVPLPSAIGATPRSPRFESVVGWCESGKPQDTASHALPPAAVAHAPQALKPKRKDNLDTELLDELAAQKERFDKTRGFSKTSNEGTESLTTILENEHRLCLRTEADNIGKQLAAVKRKFTHAEIERAHYKKNPSEPFRRLVRTYEKQLENPKSADAIAKLFREGVRLDANELTAAGIPQLRWGAMADLIRDIENGKITDAFIIAKLKEQLAKVDRACVQKNAFHNACSPEMLSTLSDVGRYMFDHNAGTQPGCEENETATCLFKISPLHPKLPDALRNYREMSQSPPPPPACDNDGWIMYQRGLANFELDKKCIEDFIQYAPASEWANLQRLKDLGARSALGFSSETGPRTQNTSTKGTSK